MAMLTSETITGWYNYRRLCIHEIIEIIHVCDKKKILDIAIFSELAQYPTCVPMRVPI